MNLPKIDFNEAWKVATGKQPKRTATVYAQSHCDVPDYENEVAVANTCVVPFTDDPEGFCDYPCGGRLEWHKERIADHQMQEMGVCQECHALYVVG